MEITTKPVLFRTIGCENVDKREDKLNNISYYRTLDNAVSGLIEEIMFATIIRNKIDF